MALYQFPATRRFNRHLSRLIKGSQQVKNLLDEGKIITAEKKYNKLCMDYAECRVLLKRRAEEIEKRKQFAEGIEELKKIKTAFDDFYALADTFKVDITTQKTDALRLIKEIETLFESKC